jgi:hypothetical protein
MERIVRKGVGTYQLTATAYDDDGEVAAISGSPTLTIYDSADVEVLASVVPGITNGTLTYAVPNASLSHLDTYRCVWTGTIAGVAQEWETYFELVGGYYFEISELRDVGGKVDLTSEVDYPDALLERKRGSVEAIIERAAGVAFVPRGYRHTFLAYRAHDYTIELPHPRIIEVYGITVDGIALTATELADLTVDARYGRITGGTWGNGQPVVVHYEHGYLTCPEPIREGAIDLTVERTIASATPARATGVSTDVGFMRFTLADGDKHPTGLPDLDAAIELFGEAGVFVG